MMSYEQELGNSGNNKQRFKLARVKQGHNCQTSAGLKVASVLLYSPLQFAAPAAVS